jgi:hypothetical protein
MVSSVMFLQDVYAAHTSPGARQAHITALLKAHLSTPIETGPCTTLSIYDTATLAGLPGIDTEEILATLTHLQDPTTGIWGDPAYSPHAALIDTLGAMTAFVRTQHPIPNLDRATRQVNRLLENSLTHPGFDTVGYEFLLLGLLRFLEMKHGIVFEFSPEAKTYLQSIERKTDEKLLRMVNLLGERKFSHIIFNRKSTLSFSSEIFDLLDQPVHITTALEVMMPDGSIALSPSATAAVVRLFMAQGLTLPSEALAFLQDETWRYGGAAVFSKARNMQIGWNYLPLLTADMLDDLLQDPTFREQTLAQFKLIATNDQDMVAWDECLFLYDLDNTVVTHDLYMALRRAGAPVDKDMNLMQAMAPFRGEDGRFSAYPMEMYPGPSPTCHALMTVDTYIKFAQAKGLPTDTALEYRAALVEQLAPQTNDFVKRLADKWNVSWSYLFQRWVSVESILTAYPDDVRTILDQALQLQQADGGWGCYGQAATLEETAMVVTGLLTTLRRAEAGVIRYDDRTIRRIHLALENAAVYFEQCFTRGNLRTPALWICKNLYRPTWLESTILSGVYMLNSYMAQRQAQPARIAAR